MKTNTTRSFLPLCLVALFLLPASASLAQQDGRVYELRTYHSHPGKLGALLERFRDHTVELFQKHGMTNVAYWTPVENDGQILIYLMAYPDRKKRDEMWKAFLNDPDWKAAYAASIQDGKLVKKVGQIFLEPTAWSPAFKIAKQNPARLFELRRYTTRPGKLPAIHARFRDHTIELFEEHGITNLAYFRLLPGQEGADHTLVYFLAHENAASRKQSFAAFSKDPTWKSVREESERDGKILVKGGVESIEMKATDFSPTQ